MVGGDEQRSREEEEKRSRRWAYLAPIGVELGQFIRRARTFSQIIFAIVTLR
jgi:hypothetical protein